MKGVILCAGKGTRLQPLSYSQPKTLLPVANKPVLVYCIENLIKAGITEIGIVINRSQEVSIKRILGSGNSLGVGITYLYQDQPKGIANALKAAEKFLAGESFLLLLGDNLIQEPLHGLKASLQQTGVNGSIMLAGVEKPSDYGIAEIGAGRILSIEEKPKQPKSNLAVIGAYAFDSSIFKAVHSILPSKRGEYEITDAIQRLINHGYTISYSVTEQHYSDVGNIERWLAANQWMLDAMSTEKMNFSKTSKLVNCTIHHPVIIGEGCELVDSTIGPYVSIGSGAKVSGCKLENSIVLQGAHLANITHKIKDSIFGQYSRVSGETINDHEEQTVEAVEYILGDKSTVTRYSLQEEESKEKDNQ